MRFRFKAFAWHLCGSATALTLTLGVLYFGWYRWPGWYLAEHAGGARDHGRASTWFSDPSSPRLSRTRAKSRRELARDIGFIVLMQLVAFTYGVTDAVERAAALLCVLRELSIDGSSPGYRA